MAGVDIGSRDMESGIMTTPIKEAPLPSALEELHRTGWLLLFERAHKHQARLEALEAQALMVQRHAADTQKDLEAYHAKMNLIYKLTDADKVRVETGEIIRAPK